MALSPKIEDLDERVRDKAVAFLSALKDAGIAVLVVETRRSFAVQKAYFAQGRKTLTEVNTLRRAAGLGLLSEGENRRRITWTIDSKHLQGLALDVVPLKDGKAWWSAPVTLWERIGRIGESCGLEWGGRWKNVDRPHFQLPQA